MSDTLIEWATKVLNPVTGCSKISPGCQHCYAERMARRLAGRAGYPAGNPFAVTWHEDRIYEPVSWRTPQRVFLGSMTDLFHPDVQEVWIHDILDMVIHYPQHTFMVLTKRPLRMVDIMADFYRGGWVRGTERPMVDHHEPIPNLWLGVTAENQEMADRRIPLLLQVPAAVRFVSVEPCLGPVDLGMSTATCSCCERWPSRWIRLPRPVHGDWPVDHATQADPGIYRAESNQHGALSVHTSAGLLGIKPAEMEILPKLDWVIAGGESGPGARPLHPDWARSIRDQCAAAGVPLFFKQWGEWFPTSQQVTGQRLTGDVRVMSNGGQVDDISLDSGLTVSHIIRCGKNAAGHLLDGQEHRAFPAAGR